MISLGSNGDFGQEGQLPWMGSDPYIRYPAVSSCVTITCVVGETLVGCHLFARNTPEKMDQSLAAFAKSAKGATAMCIAGVFNSWQPNDVRNFTRYNYVSLSIKICGLIGFKGKVVFEDTSGRGETLDVRYIDASNIELTVS